MTFPLRRLIVASFLLILALTALASTWIFFSFLPENAWHATFSGWRFIAILAVLLAVVVAAGCALAAAITRPLSALSAQLDPEQTGIPVRADENAPGEIGTLARRLNRYLEALRRAGGENGGQSIYRRAFENLLDGACITDAQGDIVAVNKAMAEMTGYSREELIGRNPRILKSGKNEEDLYVRMWESLRKKGRWQGEIWNRRKNSEIYPEMLKISALYDEQGAISHFVGTFHDISKLKQQEEEIARKAYHDALTGLPNRSLAHDRITVSIAHVKRGGTKLAVLFLDLDNFKNINDTFGHECGDKLLLEAAGRLQAQVREEDTVARLGGDEFLILVAAILSEDMAVNIAQRILRAFSSPFSINGIELAVTSSIGISFYPQDGDSSAVLVKNADIAMYQAKSRGKNNYHLFTSELNERMVQQRQLENELRQAVASRSFEVFFQPKLDPYRETVLGAEALVRWRKEEGTLLKPEDFIPMAEETGLIIPLDHQVLEKSCEMIRRLREEGYGDLVVSVNLSPMQFTNAGLVESVLAILRHHEVFGSSLELELTESAITNNPVRISDILCHLASSGIGIALDDFGTGYSSLLYLQKFPIGTLKIDRSIIKDLTRNPDADQLVSTILIMARSLGICAAAEGVETQNQLDWLKNRNCEQVQGIYYSRPLPAEDFLAYLRGRRAGQ